MAKAKDEKVKTIDVVNLTVTKPTKYLVTIKGVGGILFNKMADLSVPETEKANQEKISKIDIERKMWREKTYFDMGGNVFIPGENIHECMKEGSQYWGARIPGEGKKTYTDVVKSAVIVEDMALGINKDSDKLIPFGKSAGSSGGGRKGNKVYKIRPMLNPWGGSYVMHVFDARLTTAVLRTIITYAGTFRGLCDWRPTYGRFELTEIEEM